MSEVENSEGKEGDGEGRSSNIYHMELAAINASHLSFYLTGECD